MFFYLSLFEVRKICNFLHCSEEKMPLYLDSGLKWCEEKQVWKGFQTKSASKVFENKDYIIRINSQSWQCSIWKRDIGIDFVTLFSLLSEFFWVNLVVLNKKSSFCKKYSILNWNFPFKSKSGINLGKLEKQTISFFRSQGDSRA